MLARIDEVMTGHLRGLRRFFTLEHQTSCPPLVNDPAVTGFVIEQARLLRPGLHPRRR